MRGDQRGLTLTEVTVTMVLASIVMFGLIGFYVNSQGTWMDASAKAITQREVTTLVETIAERVHAGGEAAWDPGSHTLHIWAVDLTPLYAFQWNANGDSLVHEINGAGADRGSPITSVCERFQCVTSDSLVTLSIGLRSPQGDRIAVDTRIALLNYPRSP